MYGKIRGYLDHVLEGLVALAMGVLVVDVTWQVITRFVIRRPSSWTEELATFLLIWVGLLGSAVALRRGAHLGIDFFVNRMKPRNRLITELVVFSSVAAFSLTVLVGGGTELVRTTLSTGQVSPALRVQMGYVYLAVPVSGVFLALYSVESLIQRLARLLRGNFVEEVKVSLPGAVDPLN
ncbi:MAG: TRAP transporter small permease [candidate division KSB1 bacterium]|nr:TRAP transporter small permease [candidate division KSB1 bacterium]